MNVRGWKTIAVAVCVLVAGAPVRAQTSPGDTAMRFPWKPGELPNHFWVVRNARPCTVVQGQGGIWLPRPVLSVGVDPNREWVCSFVWSSPSASPDVAALRRLPGARVESDPPIVVPNYGPDAERDFKWFGPLHALTRARLGIPDARPEHGGPRAVEVAILDTAADAPLKPGGYLDPVGHGRAVGRVVAELACGEVERCAADIVHVPALPFFSYAKQALAMSPSDAGALGTRGILAAAIERVSSTWHDAPRSKRPRNLVINLSLGWSGCWEIDPAGQTGTAELWGAKRGIGSEAVLQAIGRAACRGALVVAASGNAESVAGCPSSPAAPGAPRHMLPGLWGGARVDARVCQRLGVKAGFDGPRPLLLGVGAVDGTDAMLSLVDHEASYVSYGQSITVKDATQPNGWTVPLSGTSMSAAAMSGIAAALWSYEPELSIPKLLGIIHGSSTVLRPTPRDGDPLARDFVCNSSWAGTRCEDIRRISLCGALGQIGASVQCDQVPAAKPVPAAFQTMTPVAPVIEAVDCDACGESCPASCSLAVDELDGQDGPWVVPQPKPPGCGTCVMVPGSPVFQGEFLYPIGSIVLLVKRPFGPDLRLALQDAQVPAFTPLTWQLPHSALGAVSARLVYRASSSLAKESGDVLVSHVAPFTTPCSGIVEACP